MRKIKDKYYNCLALLATGLGTLLGWLQKPTSKANIYAVLGVLFVVYGIAGFSVYVALIVLGLFFLFASGRNS